MNLRHKYITIEGAIGAGKTSFAQLLAEKSRSLLILENLDDNPFVQKFYEDRDKYAFQTQLFFLLSRYNQQRELLQQDLFYDCVICDYLFAKDRIFAYLNLNEDELMLYERIYEFLDDAIPRPDLVVYLQASTDTLVERIKNRGRKYEENISEDYIRDLNERYNSFFFHYSHTPLLVVNTDNLDFVNNERDLMELMEEIRRMKGGKEYYILHNDL
ncbi:AAA family ATPase [Candidatus Poribacteria bacterium]|nr:AAA family ATPase [Candidatus Poribacteria bacterium]